MSLRMMQFCSRKPYPCALREPGVKPNENRDCDDESGGKNKLLEGLSLGSDQRCLLEKGLSRTKMLTPMGFVP